MCWVGNGGGGLGGGGGWRGGGGDPSTPPPHNHAHTHTYTHTHTHTHTHTGEAGLSLHTPSGRTMDPLMERRRSLAGFESQPRDESHHNDHHQSDRLSDQLSDHDSDDRFDGHYEIGPTESQHVRVHRRVGATRVPHRNRSQEADDDSMYAVAW
jgi:hypothetical protein